MSALRLPGTSGLAAWRSAAPARGDHHRDLGDAELPGGEYPGVARDQATILAHQRWRYDSKASILLRKGGASLAGIPIASTRAPDLLARLPAGRLSPARLPLPRNRAG